LLFSRKEQLFRIAAHQSNVDGSMTDPIYRIRASALCIRDEHILALKHQSDSGSGGFWGIPGGKIESGETPEQAAIRETFEETGYRVEVIHNPRLFSDYEFVWQGQTYLCRTHWLCVQPVPGAIHNPHAGDEEYITALRWLPIKEWRQLFAGHQVIQSAISMLLQQLRTRELIN